MSISAVGGGVGYTPAIPTQPPVSPQPTGATAKASDPDGDGDRDTPGRLDVRA